jgi:small subunit ribosomal protein S6
LYSARPLRTSGVRPFGAPTDPADDLSRFRPRTVEECADQMQCYEHTLIARQDLSPQQAQALAETYSGVLTEHGAEVTKTEYWGLRNLAYRIKKNRKGHYLHLNVRAPADAITELERQERLSDDVLRYLTVKVEELEEGPSAVMQSRSSREERTRRPHEDGERPRRAHDDEDRPRRGHDDEERPRRAREDEERPRRARDDAVRRGRAAEDGGESAPAAGPDEDAS